MIGIIVVVKLVQWVSKPAVAANAPAPAPPAITAPVTVPPMAVVPPAGNPGDVLVHSKKTVTLPNGEVVTVSDETKRLTGDEAAAKRQEFKNDMKARTRLPPAVAWTGAPDPQKPGPQLRGNEPIRADIPHMGFGKNFGSFPYSPSVFVFGGGVTPIGGELQVLSLQTGTPAGRIRDAEFDEDRVALSSDGKHFAGGSRLEETVSLISIGTSQKPQTVKLDDHAEFLAFAGLWRRPGAAASWRGRSQPASPRSGFPSKSTRTI
jgi:hypothetical protein